MPNAAGDSGKGEHRGEQQDRRRATKPVAAAQPRGADDGSRTTAGKAARFHGDGPRDKPPLQGAQVTPLLTLDQLLLLGYLVPPAALVNLRCEAVPLQSLYSYQHSRRSMS